MNLLQESYLTTSTSGIPYYIAMQTTSLDLGSLVEYQTTVSIPSGYYFSFEAEFGAEFVADNFKLYASELVSGDAFITYSEFSHNEWISDGSYNNNFTWTTPFLTGDSEPSPYRAIATSSGSGFYAYKAFDGFTYDSSYCWLSASEPSVGSPQSLSLYVGPAGKVINKYAIQGRNWVVQVGSPKSWTLEGARLDLGRDPDIGNDSDWIVLDTRSNQSELGEQSWAWYTFVNGTAYKWYRMKITEARGYGWVAVGNLALIESSDRESVPVTSWTQQSLTWDGSCYSCDLPDDVGIITLRCYYANGGPTQTVSGACLTSHIPQLTISGVTADPLSGFSFLPTKTGPYLLSLRNDQFDGHIQPRVQLKYTGNFEVDRNLFVSTDYARLSDKDTATWEGLDNGIVIPEAIPWNRGKSENLQEVKRELVLEETATFGSWVSPVFDVGDIPSYAYIYLAKTPQDLNQYQNISLYVRSSDTPPPEATFSVISTENTHRNLMYDHKRIHLDSHGNVLAQVMCDDSGGDYKIWRDAQLSWTEQRLRYHASINDKNTVAFLAPGLLDCGETSFEQELFDYNHWYSLCSSTMEDSSSWGIGVTVSGLPWGQYHTVSFTKTFPIEASDSFFTAAITSQYYPYTDPRVVVSFSLQDGAETRFSVPMITLLGTYLHGSDHYDIIADPANSSWWVYIGGNTQKIFKFDIGSVNKVKFFGGSADTTSSGGVGRKYSNLYEGYTTFYDFTEDVVRLVEIPNKNYAGFWVLTPDTIKLYQEVYEYKPYLLQQGTDLTGFADLYQGSCDTDGNLWAVDQQQQRVVRANFNRVCLGESNPVDFDMTISGAVAVYAHPSDGSCYVLTAKTIDSPITDTILKVSVGQTAGSRPKFLCQVPGIYSDFAAPFYKTIDFIGRASSSYTMPYSSNPYWGESGYEWQEYQDLTKPLPRGRYKQFKVVIKREGSDKVSPALQRFRLPKLVGMEHLNRFEEQYVAVKALVNRSQVTGSFETKLLVWWLNEEYNG